MNLLSDKTQEIKEITYNRSRSLIETGTSMGFTHIERKRLKKSHKYFKFNYFTVNSFYKYLNIKDGSRHTLHEQNRHYYVVTYLILE